MNRRKIISVIIVLALCGIIAGIIFSFIVYKSSKVDVGISNSKHVSAAFRILELQGKTSKEKAMLLYDSYATTSLSIAHRGLEIEAQLADTVDLQMLGLSGRDGLSRKAGLLFSFTEDGKYPFWMKDMSFAIDIIWIDQNMKIVHIEHSVDPNTFPKTFDSPMPARYVLEIASGLSREHNLQKGDGVIF